MKRFYSFSACFVGFLSVQTAYAGCTGNACAAGYLTKQDGCMVVVNNSDRPIKFTQGFGHSPTVYPHSSEKVLSIAGAANRTGECMQSLGKDYTLNYAD